MKKVIAALYFFILCVYAVFSYSLTDPNLVLTTWAPYWQFQQFMWHTFFNNALLLSEVYAVLITLLFGCYFYFFNLPANLTKKTKPQFSHYWLLLFLFLPLIFSYNALSHDVFNYIFNAKIILVYHANPQVKVALDYPHDEWIRFMNNTNTPAPYGLGWSAISLIPFALGFGKFTLTWILFRLFSVLSVGVLLASFFALAKTEQHKNKLLWPIFFMVIFNPLFLIEVISNSHNDLWMLAPALFSLAIIHQTQNFHFKKILLSLLLLAFSISIKFSTLVLLPVWGAIFFEQVLAQYQLPALLRKMTSFIHLHYADVSALLLFLPLLTPRSQQFNPWYLVWLLVWLPFIRWNWLKGAVLVLSISSLYRYLPWMLAGGYSDQILLEQKLITFMPLVVYLIIILARQLISRNFQHSSVE